MLKITYKSTKIGNRYFFFCGYVPLRQQFCKKLLMHLKMQIASRYIAKSGQIIYRTSLEMNQAQLDETTEKTKTD
jgi:hypothetical protein